MFSSIANFKIWLKEPNCVKNYGMKIVFNTSEFSVRHGNIAYLGINVTEFFTLNPI